MFKLTTKFLIVDDFSSMRKIVKKVLADLGYENMVEAIDGQVAYDLIVKHSKTNNPIEFIITDWNMPNMSGLELLKKCRSNDVFARIPIMMVTAENEQSQILTACKLGVTEYVVKPFSPAVLKEKLEISYKKLNANTNAA